MENCAADDPPQPTPGNVFRAGETAVIALGAFMDENAEAQRHKEAKQTDLLTPNGVREDVRRVSGEQIRLFNKTEMLAFGWRVLDVDGEMLAEGETRGDTLSLPHSALGGRFGAFTLQVHAAGASGETAAPADIRFAFLPPGDVRPCHWVGTQFHYWRRQWGRGDERLLDLAAAAGIGIVRDEPSWAYCEKTPGRYEMSPFHEELVDGLVKRGMKFLCLLTFDNPGAYPDNPLDADAFARWAAWMADHLKGRCDTFEIFNEPHNFRFWKQYGPLYGCTDRREPRWIRHFTDFTRTVDEALAGRGLRVGVGSEDWPDLLYTMLEQGIARPHNLVTIHPYDHRQPFPERAGWLRDGFADLRRRITESFPQSRRDWEQTDLLTPNGVHENVSRVSGEQIRVSNKKGSALSAAPREAKIAITEVGWTTYDATRDATHAPVGNYPPSTFAEQAERIVRMYLIARQAGAEFVCQYDFKDDGTNPTKREHNWGMLDYWGRPKPSYAAVAAMTRFVGDATFIEELSTDPDTYRIQHFRNGDGADIYVIWSVEGNRNVMTAQEIRNVLKPTDDTCYDMYGNRIASPRNGRQVSFTEDPVYMVAGASFAEGAEWGPPWLVPATSEPTLIYANAAESLLWNTTPFGGTTVRWDKPAGATSATLTVTGDGWCSTYDHLTGESCEVSLPGGAATADGEDVVTLTLAFDDGTVRTAYLGAVTGLGSGGSAMAAPPRNAALPSWAKFRDRAVVAIPFGATALTVNGEPLPGLDGSAGWRSIRHASGVADYDLSMTLDGEADPLLTTLTAKAYATTFIVH